MLQNSMPELILSHLIAITPAQLVYHPGFIDKPAFK